MNKKYVLVLNLQIKMKILKIRHALCKHNIWFFGSYLLEKEKYLVIESYFCVV